MIVVTEVVTAAALLAAIPADPVLVVPVLATLGFVGNGTSSALYSAVAGMVHVDRRAQGYGLYYTLSLGPGVPAPVLLRSTAGSVGVAAALVAVAPRRLGDGRLGHTHLAYQTVAFIREVVRHLVEFLHFQPLHGPAKFLGPRGRRGRFGPGRAWWGGVGGGSVSKWPAIACDQEFDVWASVGRAVSGGANGVAAPASS